MRRIRFAFRSLAKAPLLSLVVVVSLGLGIGVNTAIFSLLHQVVLSALPIPHPEQIVLLTAPGEFKNGSSSDNDSGGMDYIFNWRTAAAQFVDSAGDSPRSCRAADADSRRHQHPTRRYASHSVAGFTAEPNCFGVAHPLATN
jgi:hypothetical protein